jgi:putative DNA primase/helicase
VIYRQRSDNKQSNFMVQQSQPTSTHLTRLHAVDFRAAGLAVIPLRLDGSKAPAVPWAKYQSQPPTPSQTEQWFLNKPRGAAVICGRVSGGLEVLDFDAEADRVFPAWSELVGEVLCWLPVVETPSGGYHVFYRCPEISGNQKIAMPADGSKPFVESRGEGGYVVACISPAAVHATGYPYVQVAGPVLPQVPTITPEQRRQLWKAAASFDESKLADEHRRQLIKQKRHDHWQRITGPASNDSPIDDFSRRCDPHVFLEQLGWRQWRPGKWSRPGIEWGTSASLIESRDGVPLLHVFSTSADLPTGNHSMGSVLAHVIHGGDFSAARASLKEQGYGNESPT